MKAHPDLMQQTLICNSTLVTISVEKRYEFVVEVPHSKDVALKTYSLSASQPQVTADMDLLTTDNYSHNRRDRHT